MTKPLCIVQCQFYSNTKLQLPKWSNVDVVELNQHFSRQQVTLLEGGCIEEPMD